MENELKSTTKCLFAISGVISLKVSGWYVVLLLLINIVILFFTFLINRKNCLTCDVKKICPNCSLQCHIDHVLEMVTDIEEYYFIFRSNN
jgi:hypothetical protein